MAKIPYNIYMDNKYFFAIAVLLYGISSFMHRIAASKISGYYIQLIATIVTVCTLPLFSFIFKNNQYKVEFNGLLISFLASCLAAVGNMAFLFGISKTTNAGSLGMIISLYPTISLILSVIFLHENITIQKAIAACLMIIGSVIMIMK